MYCACYVIYRTEVVTSQLLIMSIIYLRVLNLPFGYARVYAYIHSVFINEFFLVINIRLAGLHGSGSDTVHVHVMTSRKLQVLSATTSLHHN